MYITSNPEYLKITSLKVVVYTQWHLTERLYHDVSHVIRHHFQKKSEVELLGETIELTSPWFIDRLVLNLGELPLDGFETQFVQRLVQQLSAALSALPQPLNQELIEPAQPAMDKAARPPHAQDEVPYSMDEGQGEKKLLTALMRFLHNGYWSVNAPVISKGVEQAEISQKEGQEGSPAQALAGLLGDVAENTSGLLPVLAKAVWQPQPRLRLWQSCSKAQRQQLFQHFTASQQRVRVPQIASIRPASLMLAAWHYCLHQPSVTLPMVPVADQRIFQSLLPVEVNWLSELLLASAARPSLLEIVLPVLPRYAETWQTQLFVPAQQILRQRTEEQEETTPVAKRPDSEPILRQRTEGQEEATPVAKRPDSEPILRQRTEGQEEATPVAKRPDSEPILRQRTEGQEEAIPVAKRPDSEPILRQRMGGQEEEMTPVVKPESGSLPQQLSVCNAGIVLLWPLLPRLFTQLELLEKPQEVAPYHFISQQAQQRAVCLLDALVWGDDEPAEWRCMVNKWLCGWPLTAPLDTEPVVDEATRSFFTSWLSSLSMQIPGMKRCGPDELRALFLQRQGVLQENRAGWHLTVEAHASDIMLTQLPWPLKQLTLPWLPEPLEMAWQLPHSPIF
ncbi:TPA: hypothetical protein SLG40_003836 [Serratia odorifera]|nr:hypothetical protein [Serratia odorifera]